MSLFDGYTVTQEIQTMIKIYPDFIRLYKYTTPFSLKRYDYDPYNPNRPKKRNKTIIASSEFLNRSFRRAKTTLTDIALCNDFDLFCTFTFALDRNDVGAKKQQMAHWLNNQRLIHGPFRYIIVAEYHKDGKAIHFHALFGGYKGKLKDSGKVQNGRKVYNISSYRGGFSTAVKIDDIEKVSSYITKYITKAMPKFKNKQRYWCSNNLKRPLKVINPLLSEQDEKLFTSVFKDSQKEILECRTEFSDKDILRIADYGRRREDDLRIEEW